MKDVISPSLLKQALQHLREHDPVLGRVIDTYPTCTITPHTNYYQALVDSIIGQQLSVKAARSIRAKFYALFGEGDLPSPAGILKRTPEELRAAGLSNAKATYVLDLASHVADGRLSFETIDSLSNEEIIRELTAVKGIGEWTAHMFMMFCMGRTDILPVGDLGIKNGIMKLYSLKTLPDSLMIQKIAKKNGWYPYETVASWYLWQSLDNMPS